MLLASTRAQLWSLGLSKEAQKEASEPKGAPLDASGEVLGCFQEAPGCARSKFYAVTYSLLWAVFSAHGEA